MDLAVLVVVDDALALFGHLHGRLRLRLVLRFDRLQRPDAAINTNVSFQLLYLIVQLATLFRHVLNPGLFFHEDFFHLMVGEFVVEDFLFASEILEEKRLSSRILKERVTKTEIQDVLKNLEILHKK